MNWEYMVVEDDSNISELGEKGWELVTVLQQKDGLKLYFKRPEQSLRDRITNEQRETVYKSLLEESI